MAEPKKSVTYTFKPMKRLAFWTLLLMGVEMAGLVLWILGMVLSMAGAAPIISAIPLLVGVVLFMPSLFISGIVSLCWVYGASRNAHALKNGRLTSSPGWAVGWFFVPIASLYKPFETMKEIWMVSAGPTDKRRNNVTMIAAWWLLFIGGNIILRVADPSNDDSASYAATPGNIAFVVGLAAILTSTALFFLIVRTVQAWQMSADTRIAETF